VKGSHDDDGGLLLCALKMFGRWLGLLDPVRGRGWDVVVRSGLGCATASGWCVSHRPRDVWAQQRWCSLVMMSCAFLWHVVPAGPVALGSTRSHSRMPRLRRDVVAAALEAVAWRETSRSRQIFNVPALEKLERFGGHAMSSVAPSRDGSWEATGSTVSL
jgi:hypothetical protein